MNILDEIVAYKKTEVAKNQEMYPVKLLEQSVNFKATPVSLREYLLREDKSGIIAEFKRKSPSKGDINPYAKVADVTLGYMQSGASAISVLTDQKFFGGANEDLLLTRKLNYCPILRKDFVISEYQIIEARSIGADAILLIAAILTKEEIKQFTEFAHSLGLEVLLEIHDEKEMEKIHPANKIVGINNRDLKTFKVDLQQSIALAHQMPSDVVKIAESGIKSVDDMVMLSEQGFEGFLIGETFMKTSNPGQACRELIQDFKQRKILSNAH